MKDIATSAILFDMFYEGNADFDPAKAKIPYFRNFDIKNIVCDGAKSALFVRGLAEAPIQGISLKNISITSDEAMKMEDADGFTLNNVWLDFKTGPVLTVKDGKNIHLDQVGTSTRPELFILATGSRTENVQVLKSDAAKAKKAVELGPDVKPEAIILK
jgi:DNA sulfur modification protein DndE